MTSERIQALCLLPGYVLFWVWVVREVRHQIALPRLKKRAAYDARHAERWEYERWINEQL